MFVLPFVLWARELAAQKIKLDALMRIADHNGSTGE
jgi:hypothetical protein